jgi:hypothetical protein
VDLDCLGLFTVGGLLPYLLKYLEESIVSLVDAVSVSSSLSGSHELDEWVSVELKELFKLDASISTLLEGLLLGCTSYTSIDLLALACYCLLCALLYLIILI